ncbi:hypothetical protein ACFFUA_32900 [Streptomyces heliomycini]|uniref:Uncharacterized protein n=1 Tax=Streptomyces heliomycini TaxID=284032 RepID=A0ABV5LKT1_9ACTN
MRRRVCAVAAGAAVVLTAAPGAVADGAPPGEEPDVAVVVHAAGRTASWHAGRRDFDRLRSLPDPLREGTERVPAEWTEGRRPRARVTVLWGPTGVGGRPRTRRAPGGDVATLRRDQLFVAGDGTPWVRTDPAPDVEDDGIRRHRVPWDVHDRLDGDGFLGGEPEASASGGGPDGPVRAVGGLGGGIAGTLLVRRAAARYRTGPPRGEPRRELIDL